MTRSIGSSAAVALGQRTVCVLIRLPLARADVRGIPIRRPDRSRGGTGRRDACGSRDSVEHELRFQRAQPADPLSLLARSGESCRSPPRDCAAAARPSGGMQLLFCLRSCVDGGKPYASRRDHEMNKTAEKARGSARRARSARSSLIECTSGARASRVFRAAIAGWPEFRTELGSWHARPECESAAARLRQWLSH